MQNSKFNSFKFYLWNKKVIYPCGIFTNIYVIDDKTNIFYNYTVINMKHYIE